MYLAFNYSPSEHFYNSTLNNYLSKGAELYSDQEKNVKRCLSEYISSEGIINGSELRENWFSTEQTDVFLSHSHKDINKVKAFAGWLYETFGLTSFIDSCAWGYCDELLNRIDKKYCYNKNKGTYDYNLRNYTTSHVHMMLSTAITETLSRSECAIFFNTPNSIMLKDELSLIEKKNTKKTTSPWILYELTMISRLKRIHPHRTEAYIAHKGATKRAMPSNIHCPPIYYDVAKMLDGIPIINDCMLSLWEETHNQDKHPLDELYRIVLNSKKNKKDD